MSSNLKVNTILPSVGSNIGLGTNGGNLNVDGGCKVQVGTALTLGHTVGVQFATQNLHSAGFEVNQINASGIITASQFKGDGSNLTSLPSQVTINNASANRVFTSDGGTTLNGEQYLTYTSQSSLNLTDGVGTSNLGGNYLLLKRATGNTNYINAPLADAELVISADEDIIFRTVHTADFNSTERVRISTNELRFNSTAQQIHLNTSDGSDNGYLNIGAAGGANNQNRGAQAVFYGNEASSYQGQLGLLAGNSGSTNGYVYFRTGGSERFRITSDGYLNFYNDSNTNKGLRWYNNVSGSAIAASIQWGNGNANWEFKHFRNDNQANNPYANIDFFTGDFSNPTRALRITNDGNHIREKHSRFACQITYQNKWYSQGEIIQFNTHVNVGNDFDNSNNKYTAPVDGTYYFFFHTNVIRNGSGTYYTDWYKNGSNVTNSLGGRMYDYYTGSGWNNLSGFIGLDLSEGDYISVHSGSADTKYDGNTYGQLIGYLVG